MNEGRLAEKVYEDAEFAGHPEGALRDVPERPIHDLEPAREYSPLQLQLSERRKRHS